MAGIAGAEVGQRAFLVAEQRAGERIHGAVVAEDDAVRFKHSVGMAQQGSGGTAEPIAHQDDPLGFLKREIEGAQEEGHNLRRLVQFLGEEAQGLLSRFPPVRTCAEAGQAKQGHAGHGIPGGFCSIVVFLHSHEQVGGVCSALPESTAGRIVETLHQGLGQLDSEGEVVRVERGFVEIDGAGQQVGIGVE